MRWLCMAMDGMNDGHARREHAEGQFNIGKRSSIVTELCSGLLVSMFMSCCRTC